MFGGWKKMAKTMLYKMPSTMINCAIVCFMSCLSGGASPSVLLGRLRNKFQPERNSHGSKIIPTACKYDEVNISKVP